MLIPSRCGLFYLHNNLKEKLMSKRKTNHLLACRHSDGQVMVINKTNSTFLWSGSDVHYLIKNIEAGVGLPVTNLIMAQIEEGTRICL